MKWELETTGINWKTMEHSYLEEPRFEQRPPHRVFLYFFRFEDLFEIYS